MCDDEIARNIHSILKGFISCFKLQNAWMLLHTFVSLFAMTNVYVKWYNFDVVGFLFLAMYVMCSLIPSQYFDTFAQNIYA